MDLNGLTADQKYKLQCWIEDVWIENPLDDYPSWLLSLHIDLMADLEDWEGKDQLSRLRRENNERIELSGYIKMDDVRRFIKAMDDLYTGKSRQCPHCSEVVESITLYEKSEPQVYSVYARPCGCRLGLFSEAPQWAVEAGIVSIVPLED